MNFPGLKRGKCGGPPAQKSPFPRLQDQPSVAYKGNGTSEAVLRPDFRRKKAVRAKEVPQAQLLGGCLSRGPIGPNKGGKSLLSNHSKWDLGKPLFPKEKVQGAPESVTGRTKGT